MTDDRTVAIQECEKTLKTKNVFVDFYKNAYVVYERVRIEGRNRLKLAFEIQCTTDYIEPHVEYLLSNGVSYLSCDEAEELLSMVETIHEKQQYNEKKKIVKKVQNKKRQLAKEQKSKIKE